MNRFFDHLHEHGHGPGLPNFLHRGRHGRRFGHRGGFGGPRTSVRHEILAVLADGPRHGYEIMLEIEKRRGGFRPSPGSIYPALAMLEDGDQVTSHEADGKKIFAITDAGRASLAEAAERGESERDTDDDEARDLFVRGATSLRGLVDAARQVARIGDPRAVNATIAILDEARRSIYKLLAEAG